MSKRVTVPGLFKTVISPVQTWLLSQGRCVGCGRELSLDKKSKGKKGLALITCQCGRIFVNGKKGYRRALLTEV